MGDIAHLFDYNLEGRFINEKKINNYSCCCVRFTLCCVWFSCEKKEIEHNECANFSDSYTYTKKRQIEEVLKNIQK